MVIYGDVMNNVTALKFLYNKIADVRDDVLTIQNTKGQPITNEEWDAWLKSSENSELTQIDDMLCSIQSFIKGLLKRLRKHNKEVYYV